MKKQIGVTWFQSSFVYTTWAEPLNCEHPTPFLPPFDTNPNEMHVINELNA